MMTFKTILLTLVLISSSSPAWAISAARSLPQLIAESDAVAVLTFNDVTQVGDEYYISATVLRVPVGSEHLTQTGPLQVSATVARPFEVGSTPGQTLPRLCFLNSSPSGWEIIPRVHNGSGADELCLPALSASELAALDQSFRDRIAGDVLAEAAAGFAAHGPLSGSDFGQIVGAISPGDVAEVAASLEALPYPYAAGLAVALQLKQSDPSAPGKLLGDSWAPLPQGFRTQVVDLLCTAYRSPSATAMPALGRLTQSGESIYVRRCAAMALRAIHVEAAVPYLADLLNSDDAELRLLGVWGLSDFVHSGQVPFEPTLSERGSALERPRTDRSTAETKANRVARRDDFLADEQRYLSYWRSWWQVNAQHHSRR